MAATEKSAKTRRRTPSEKRRPSIFWLLAGTAVPLIGFLAKIEIEGEENLPAEGSYVLAPNHYSEFDPLIVAMVAWRLGRAPRFMAKESLFRVPGLGWILRTTDMVPVSRESSSASAKQTLVASEKLVAQGGGVIVYPEGSLTRDPEMWPMRGKTGAVRLALDAGIPLIPVAHWGAQAILPRYGKKLSFWPPRKRVRVIIGAPVDLSPFQTAPVAPAALVDATTVLMDDIAALLGRLRGETPPAQRWDPSSHGQKETGRLES